MDEADSNEESSPRDVSCVVKLLLTGIVVPLVLVVSLVIWWTARQSVASGELTKKLAEASAAGLPIDDESLQTYYAQATVTDDVEAWQQLLAGVSDDEFKQQVRKLPGPFSQDGLGIPTPQQIEAAKLAADDARDDDDEMLDDDFIGFGSLAADRSGVKIGKDGTWDGETEVRKFLADAKPWFDQADRLSQAMQPVRLPLTFQGIETNLDAMQELRSIARMHQWRFSVSLLDGDSSQATASVLATLATARAIDGQPILVSALISRAIRQLAMGMIRQGLEFDLFEPDPLTQMDAAFDQFENPADILRRVLIGERVAALVSLRALGADKVPDGFVPSAGPASRLALFYFMTEAIDSVGVDVTESVPALIELNDRLDREGESAGLVGQIDNLGRNLMAPPLRAIAIAFASDRMQENLARTAMATRRYHAADGRWPADLPALANIGTPMERLSPIGGGQFGYRVERDQSALIWGFELREQIDALESVRVPANPPTAPKNPYSGEQEENVWVYRIRHRD